MQSPTPLIIGHRGACGYLPEHTIESYRRAIDLGADVIETDVVLTRDGKLVCRHDCELSLTTNIASLSQFASRRTTKTIDGVTHTGWFVEDLTLEEMRTLHARQGIPFRDRSFDNQYRVATFRELLEEVARSTSSARPVGLMIEVKHAAYFESVGLPMEESVAQVIEQFALSNPRTPLWAECFEIEFLRRLNCRIATPLIQLLDAPDAHPPDVNQAGGSLTYGQMTTPAGLAAIAEYASGIGAYKRLIVPTLVPPPLHTLGEANHRLAPPTSLVADAHAAGLAVYAWTFRNEPYFLAHDYEENPGRECRQFADLGVDGVITDFPDAAHLALRQR